MELRKMNSTETAAAEPMIPERGGAFASALTVAGSDSGGNAGIQADIRAFHVFGLHACTAIAALTAQNPSAVTSVHVPPPEFLEAQLDAIFAAYAPRAAKTGMLATAQCVRSAARMLRGRTVPETGATMPVVVDPVMVATSGARLLAPDAERAVDDDLLPIAALATPNVPEAETLSGLSIGAIPDMTAAARRIRERAGCAVLVKGGHLSGDAASRDVLSCEEGDFLLETPAVQSPASTHGTGCSLSAAIAASLALGRSLVEAVREGKAYVFEAIRRSGQVGPAAAVLGTPPRPIKPLSVSIRPLPRQSARS